jgi:hypothetical protein
VSECAAEFSRRGAGLEIEVGLDLGAGMMHNLRNPHGLRS